MRRKHIIGLVLSALGMIAAWAQNPPPGTISHPPTASSVDTNQPQSPATNLVGQGNLSFTNSAGGVYSVDQLAGQLQNLRQVVDQTVPMLNAFTETYSNSVAGGPHTLGGAISNILSGVLNRNTNAAAPSGQSSSTGTNLLSVLQQLLTTNAPSGALVNPTKFQDVVALQQRLQSIPPLLQALNVGTNTNQFATPSSAPRNPSSENRPLPTGR